MKLTKEMVEAVLGKFKTLGIDVEIEGFKRGSIFHDFGSGNYNDDFFISHDISKQQIIYALATFDDSKEAMAYFKKCTTKEIDDYVSWYTDIDLYRCTAIDKNRKRCTKHKIYTEEISFDDYLRLLRFGLELPTWRCKKHSK